MYNIARILVAFLYYFPLAAFAQAITQEPDSAEAATLDTIVVTANKRVEHVQVVPKHILVVSSETLAKSGISTISELGNLIPSIGGMVDPRTNTPPLRGISSFGTSVGVQSQTGVVIDDVPQAAYSSLFKELADIQSVEVLAGPQSTLSGRNASAGLINVRTREPNDYFSAEAFFEHASDNQQRFSTFLTGPINTTLAFSVSAFSNKWDGHLRNATLTRGKRSVRLGGWDTQGARGKLRWHATDKLTATLTAYTMESTSLPIAALSGQAYLSVDPEAQHTGTGTPGNGLRFNQIYPHLPVGQYNTWVGGNNHGTVITHDRGGVLRAEYELDNGMTLITISALGKAEIRRRDVFISFDGLNVVDPNYPDTTRNSYDTQTKSQELRLVSPDGQPLAYVIGAIYSDEDTLFPIQRLGFGPVNWIRAFDIQSVALFARGTLHIDKRNDLTLGLRYQNDTQGYRWDFLPNVETATVPARTSSSHSTYDFFSTELSWRYVLSQDISAYLSAAHAQSGQVYDMGNFAGAFNAVLLPLDSQKVRNFEVGLKSQWWDRRLILNTNLFHATYDHYQIRTRETVTDPRIVPTFRLLTIGEVQTRGVEVEGRLRANERLDLSLGAAWVDARIKDFPNAQCYLRQTMAGGCVTIPGTTATRQLNLAGNHMPHAPEFKLAGTASYFLPLDHRPFDLEFTTTWRWQSKASFDYRGNPNLYQSGYGILNLGIRLRERNDRYAMSLFINNVLNNVFYIDMGDDDYWSSAAYFGNYARDSFRYAGVNLRVNF